MSMLFLPISKQKSGQKRLLSGMTMQSQSLMLTCCWRISGGGVTMENPSYSSMYSLPQLQRTNGILGMVLHASRRTNLMSDCRYIAPHNSIDGRSLMKLMEKVLNWTAEELKEPKQEAPKLEWGSEIVRLPPTLIVAAELHRKALPTANPPPAPPPGFVCLKAALVFSFLTLTNLC
jgi:hypothetical protein